MPAFHNEGLGSLVFSCTCHGIRKRNDCLLLSFVYTLLIMGDTKSEIKLSGYFAEVRKKKDFRDRVAAIQNIREISHLRDKETRQQYLMALDDLCDAYGFPGHPWWDIFERLVIDGVDTEIDLSSHRYSACRVRNRIKNVRQKHCSEMIFYLNTETYLIRS